MLRSVSISLIVALAMAGSVPSLAASKKAAPRKASKAASKKPSQPSPVADITPPKPGGFMVPKPVVLRPTKPAEAEANAVWNVRAALNVAALQCQFSPFLATVKNYNDMLKHHSEELARAQTVMIAHFKRYDGARGLNSFDQYSTKIYNSFTTLDAQYRFCEVAGQVGREVLAVPKGQLGAEALRRNGEVRAALMQQPLSPALEVRAMTPIYISEIVVTGD